MFNCSKNTFLVFLSTVISLAVSSATSIAGVYFITDDLSFRDSFYLNRSCTADGYSLTKCIGNQTPSNFCPTDSSYFKTCVCDSSNYKYDSYNCPYPKVLSGGTCDGKYASCTCEEKYQYDTSNCQAPKILSGKSCNGRYENCSCPVEYYKSCTGNLIGGSDSCGGKFKSCKCASIYKTCSRGPEVGASACYEEGAQEVKYSECKGNSCENGGYSPYVPENNKCTQVSYNGNTCYADCREINCNDGGYYSKDLSGNIKCPVVSYYGNTCYNCDSLCGHCDKFTGKCKVDCMNDCKLGLWYENRLNGGFVCENE